MISEEQIARAEKEFRSNSSAAESVARDAERDLEYYTYHVRPFDPSKRNQLLQDYQDADYFAESRAWILQLIRDRKRLEVMTKSIHRMSDLLEQSFEFITKYEDVVDGQDGQPEANKAMHLCREIREELGAG